MSGLMRERRRALTVPALLLVTVSSTVPRAARYRLTGTGSGLSTVRRSRNPRSTIPASTTSVLTQPDQARTMPSAADDITPSDALAREAELAAARGGDGCAGPDPTGRLASPAC